MIGSAFIDLLKLTKLGVVEGSFPVATPSGEPLGSIRWVGLGLVVRFRLLWCFWILFSLGCCGIFSLYKKMSLCESNFFN